MTTALANGSTAISGDTGFVVVSDPGGGNSKRLARVTQFTINPSSSETAWGDSDSEGFTNRKRARRDCTGSIQCRLDSEQTDKVTDEGASQMLKDGDIVELVLWEDNSNDENYWKLPRALMQNVQETVDMDSKEVISVSADFGADGKFYYPGDSNAAGEIDPSA